MPAPIAETGHLAPFHRLIRDASVLRRDRVDRLFCPW